VKKKEKKFNNFTSYGGVDEANIEEEDIRVADDGLAEEYGDNVQ